VFARGIALMRDAGAEIIDNVALDDFNAQLGVQFLKGFARKVDAGFAMFPGARRNWADVCTSQRIRPEWSASECVDIAASAPAQEQQAVDQIAGNQRGIVAVLDRLRLDALLYPVDGRGGAHNDESSDIACFLAGASGLPAAAFPIGLDERGLPVGLELLGRPLSDESLVAMMAALEQARGPFPKPKPIPVRADLAALDIPRLNELHLRLGWSAFRMRHGEDLGALTPEKFRALTRELVQSAVGKR
jgi:Asp-tRNA(Asn)/Glu-tRNA(Gln) amidotransferase A subunit family amidase